MCALYHVFAQSDCVRNVVRRCNERIVGCDRQSDIGRSGSSWMARHGWFPDLEVPLSSIAVVSVRVVEWRNGSAACDRHRDLISWMLFCCMLFSLLRHCDVFRGTGLDIENVPWDMTVMSSPNHLTSDIEDAFSSNFLNYIPASPDYVPA
ncbi:hypothetical protein Tco_1377818 [Tanacetum coccineum]